MSRQFSWNVSFGMMPRWTFIDTRKSTTSRCHSNFTLQWNVRAMVKIKKLLTSVRTTSSYIRYTTYYKDYIGLLIAACCILIQSHSKASCFTLTDILLLMTLGETTSNLVPHIFDCWKIRRKDWLINKSTQAWAICAQALFCWKNGTTWHLNISSL